MGEIRRDGRRRCAYCRETFARDDRRAVCVPGHRRSSDGWCCSRECLRRFLLRAAGEEVEPYYGERLDFGFELIHASELGDR